MKGKKIASSLAAVLMLTGVLSACSSSNNANGGNTGSSNTPSTSTNSEA